MQKIKTLLTGIDSLYMGFYVDIDSATIESFERLKEKAREKDQEQNIGTFGPDHSLNLQPHGVRKYKYILSNSAVTFNINERIKNDKYPNVRVQFKAGFLWSKGPEQAYNEVIEIIEEIGEIAMEYLGENGREVRKEKVSRVDISSDFMGVHKLFTDYNRVQNEIVKRARKVTCVHTSDEINAWSIGSRSSKIYGRIYNKSLEIKQTKKKAWFYDLWDIGGKDCRGNCPGFEDVWRVEFELKRAGLKEFQIDRFEDLKNCAGDVWRYLTSEWLSLRLNDAQNTTERSITKVWQEIQLVKDKQDFFGGECGVIRCKEQAGTVKELMAQIKGCMTSVGTALNISNIDQAVLFVRGYLKDKFSQEDYIEDIFKKRPKYQTAIA